MHIHKNCKSIAFIFVLTSEEQPKLINNIELFVAICFLPWRRKHLNISHNQSINQILPASHLWRHEGGC